jgi:hypothetical protein
MPTKKLHIVLEGAQGRHQIYTFGRSRYVDDATVPAAPTVLFATDSKLFVSIISIVPFVIRVNVECLTYSFIYVFKLPSSSARHKFINGVLNMGGSSEDKGGRTGNNVAP